MNLSNYDQLYEEIADITDDDEPYLFHDDADRFRLALLRMILLSLYALGRFWISTIERYENIRESLSSKKRSLKLAFKKGVRRFQSSHPAATN